MKRHASFILPQASPPENLLDFLVRRFTYHARPDWQAHLEQGRVLVNQRQATGSDRVTAGDRVDYLMEDRSEPVVDVRVRSVFEDEDILVLDKPGNLPCHPAGAYFNHTLWAILKDAPFLLTSPLLVNRLDRETSGLVVVAKSPDMAKASRSEFAERRVEKVYLALVEGSFPDQREAGGIMKDIPAGLVRKQRVFEEGGDSQSGGSDWAQTTFKCLARGAGISLVEARPLTGRLHQIRATLQAIGFPVVGDKLYGRDPALFLRFRQDELTSADRSALRLDRQALHAARLLMRHPRSGNWLNLDAPMPDDMAALARECGLLE
jgi:23S rRNA pseudouridine955/2504/2580 synthase/23S rRNA pseudouridine1911/1915/1917 synthase